MEQLAAEMRNRIIAQLSSLNENFSAKGFKSLYDYITSLNTAGYLPSVTELLNELAEDLPISYGYLYMISFLNNQPEEAHNNITRAEKSFPKMMAVWSALRSIAPQLLWQQQRKTSC